MGAFPWYEKNLKMQRERRGHWCGSGKFEQKISENLNNLDLKFGM